MRAGPAVPHPRRHLHEQGRGRDARPPRRASWATTSRGTSGSARSTPSAAKLLRRHGEAIGLAKNFVIYDADDQKAVVTRVLRALDLDEKRYPPRACLARIHKEKQELRGPDEMDDPDP